LYRVKRKDFADMRRDVQGAAQHYPINIYLGLEANLMRGDGRLDITEDDLVDLDILLCGYHSFLRSCPSFFSFSLPNLLPSGNRRRVKNTKAYIAAMERYPVDIITHLKSKADVDVAEVAKAAKAHGTLIELNGKRVNMTDEDIGKVLENGADFIVNSDAHSAIRVGNFAVPQAIVGRLGIPAERIANLGRLPDFRLKKWKKKE
jgi:putative hydrolase